MSFHILDPLPGVGAGKARGWIFRKAEDVDTLAGYH